MCILFYQYQLIKQMLFSSILDFLQTLLKGWSMFCQLQKNPINIDEIYKCWANLN